MYSVGLLHESEVPASTSVAPSAGLGSAAVVVENSSKPFIRKKAVVISPVELVRSKSMVTGVVPSDRISALKVEIFAKSTTPSWTESVMGMPGNERVPVESMMVAEKTPVWLSGSWW